MMTDKLDKPQIKIKLLQDVAQFIGHVIVSLGIILNVYPGSVIDYIFSKFNI